MTLARAIRVSSLLERGGCLKFAALPVPVASWSLPLIEADGLLKGGTTPAVLVGVDMRELSPSTKFEIVGEIPGPAQVHMMLVCVDGAVYGGGGLESPSTHL